MNCPQKRNIILITLAFLVGILLGGRLITTANSQEFMVTSVIDGDTFNISLPILNSWGLKQRVRIIGIDAPEKGECYYQQSTEALGELIDNKKVRLDKDITDKDKYGRLLRHVILVADDENMIVSKYLVEHGFVRAVSSSPDVRYRDLLATAQATAKKNLAGLWGACQPSDLTNSNREIDVPPSDPSCFIKGNISEKGFGKTYLIPGCDNYESVKIDTRKGEQYFCSETEAQAAGFRKATNCP